MTGAAVNETRTYNSMGQLTQLTGTGGVSIQYNYASAGANNGQMASQVQSGETITYQYDSLKRLSSATSSQGWGQGFSYDGFGNLTAKNALSGNPPVGSYGVDASTNRLTGASYDANGNQLSAPYGYVNAAYDVANRLTTATLNGTANYEYDPSNKRGLSGEGCFWQHDAGVVLLRDRREEARDLVDGCVQRRGELAVADGAGVLPRAVWCPRSR